MLAFCGGFLDSHSGYMDIRSLYIHNQGSATDRYLSYGLLILHNFFKFKAVVKDWHCLNMLA